VRPGDFPVDARHDAGHQLDKVQRGLQPGDLKRMPTKGRGAEEIRIRDDAGNYRVIYTARLADAVYSQEQSLIGDAQFPP
jgi:phage-related protein